MVRRRRERDGMIERKRKRVMGEDKERGRERRRDGEEKRTGRRLEGGQFNLCPLEE